MSSLILFTWAHGESSTFFGKDEVDKCDGETCEFPEQSQTENQIDDSVVYKTGVDSATSSAQQEYNTEEINVIITFTNAENNVQFQNKFKLTMSSMLKHATTSLAIHIIGDEKSQIIAADIIEEVQLANSIEKDKYRVCDC